VNCGIAYLDDSDDSVWAGFVKILTATFLLLRKFLFRKKNVLHINFFYRNGNFLGSMWLEYKSLECKKLQCGYIGMQNGGFLQLNATGLRDGLLLSAANGKWFVGCG